MAVYMYLYNTCRRKVVKTVIARLIGWVCPLLLAHVVPISERWEYLTYNRCPLSQSLRMRVTICHPLFFPLPSPSPSSSPSKLTSLAPCSCSPLPPRCTAHLPTTYHPTTPHPSSSLGAEYYTLYLLYNMLFFLPDPMRLLSLLFQTANVAILAGVDRLDCEC